MPYIPLEAHLPGITGLLECRKDSAAPIRELTQILLRGSSTLSEGERELIATVVSHRNECTFCVTAHTAAADILLGDEETSQRVRANIETAPVSDKMKTLLTIAAQTQQSGLAVTEESIQQAIPIIRNEELILIYAEANIQKNNTTEALKAINRIRTGHNLPVYSGATTQDALTAEMLKQRRYSLFYEGHRWIDMRRYNLLSTLPIDRTGDDVWDKFPLPVSEQ